MIGLCPTYVSDNEILISEGHIKAISSDKVIQLLKPTLVDVRKDLDHGKPKPESWYYVYLKQLKEGSDEDTTVVVSLSRFGLLIPDEDKDKYCVARLPFAFRYTMKAVIVPFRVEEWDTVNPKVMYNVDPPEGFTNIKLSDYIP